jgi:hypothetical protein
MPTPTSRESAFLNAGVAKLTPLLAEHGFTYKPGDTGSASGGPFATGTFWRGNLEIGLIVRSRNKLGCPSYSEGRGYAGHDDLLKVLGVANPALIPSEFPVFIAANKGDPFDALAVDLQRVLLMLRNSEIDFRSAIAAAHQMFQDKLFGRSR